MIWLSLSRNNKYVEGGKIPYFTVSMPPEGKEGKWREIGAAWKAKSGKPGMYSLGLKGVKLVFEEEKKDDTYETIND